MSSGWQEWHPNMIWVKEYPIHFFGMDIRARVTVVRLSDGTLWVHSPCEMDAETQATLNGLGEVRCILAHGDLITENAKVVARSAWRRPLRSAGSQ